MINQKFILLINQLTVPAIIYSCYFAINHFLHKFYVALLFQILKQELILSTI